MADLPSFSDLFGIARDEALARNPRLTRDAIEREGSDVNAVVAAGVAASDEVVGQLADVAASLFLDTATDTALDRWVFDRFGLSRKPASASFGSVNFSTTALNPGAFSIPLGTRVGTQDGLQFVTTAATTFLAASVGPVTVPVRSSLAGASQQAQANTITSILTSIVGQPADLVVNNPLATAGADDEESDDSLRTRARGFFTTARRGTIAAIRQAALGVPGVRTATAFEVLDAFGRPAKVTQLIVADAFTDLLVGVSPTPASYQTQSQVLADTVFAALDDVRAAGIYVQVSVASVVMQPIQLALRFQAGADVEQAAYLARVAVVNTTNQLSPGSPLRVSALIAALQLVPGLFVTGLEIVSPAGDVIPLSLQVLRTTLGLVAAISLQPDRALQGSTASDGV